ncbi:thiosulfate sulfurtransferase [Strongylocentrotus purpuratus]|uniref:Sulfurtransferase n=1 Tax=Strongylocentrotus purpuratus TaxID=7668 RepID=A0A7M7HK38_STRPU|nr:thiosulfate sulfurtransferase [Strongylocentrotus purpuratus]
MRNLLIVQSLALFRTRFHHAANSVYGTVACNVPASHIHTTVSSHAQYPGLVSTEWLAEAMGTRKTPDGRPFRVLDATRIGMETGKAHIPGSHHIDIHQLSNKDSSYHFTAPTPANFAEYVGKTLGVDNDTHVVLYEGKVKVMTAPRMWWMFRLFNHDAVSVLDGGLQQWVAENRTVTEIPTPVPEAVEFKVTERREDLFKSYEDVLQNVKDPKFQIMDSRLVEWYDGSQPSVYEGINLGIMKMATNIPFPNVLVDDGSDKFRSPADLRALFKSNGIDLSRPLTSSCYVGITASILALGAFHAGKEDVAVYDGSWEEYSQKGPEDSMNLYTYEKEP